MQNEEQNHKLKTMFNADRRSGSLHIANHLMDEFNVITIGENKKEILVYKDGVYVSGEDIIRNQIRDILEECSTSHYINEIIKTIEDRTIRNREELEINSRYINLNNGILDVENDEFIEHDPSFTFFAKIPVNYNPETDCPNFKQYLFDVLNKNDVKIIQQWIGYCLLREYSIKKAIIFVGEGDTGKTTLISTINALTGEKNVAGISLQKISSDKFAVSHLYNKYVNLYDDLSFKDIKDNGAFKIATGGGLITGEKKFGDQFLFRNYAKLTFACNKIPDVQDTNDDAYFKRWIIIQLSKSIPPKKQDKNLIKKLTKPEELSGILNFALAGLRELLENQEFTYDKTPDEIKIEMLRSGSPIANFVYDCLEKKDGSWIKKDDMYSRYAKYVQQKELPVESDKAFSSKLPKYATYTSSFKPLDSQTQKQTHAWKDVIFKEDKYDQELNPQSGLTPEEESLLTEAEEAKEKGMFD